MATVRRAHRRRRGRRPAPRPATVVLAGLLTTAAIVGFIWLAENSYNGLPFLSYRTVYASVPNIGHLIPHDPVDIAGVRVGQVLRTFTKDNRPVAELQLQGVGPLPTNSTVVVRADGLLGARYVQLTPGRAHTHHPNGATIFGGANSFYDGLPEWLNLFDGKTRSAIGYMLNSLGQGVEGNGQALNQAIHVGAPSGADFDIAADAILDRNGGRAASNFLPQLSSGASALDSARNDIVASFTPTARGVQPLERQPTPLRQGLQALATLEPATDDAFSTRNLYPLLGDVLALSRAAAPVLPIATRGLTAANRLLDVADGRAAGADHPSPLLSLHQVLDQVPDAVPATLDTLHSLKPDLAPLRQAFVGLVNPVSQLAIHGCDIQNFSTAVRSLVSYGSTPPGNWGPNAGFPLTVLAGPQEGANLANVPLSYPTEDYYPAPCAYSPGATMNYSSLLDIVSGLLPNQ
jgi:ABC-type transporter Mla subunit MlaD